ncbi:serine hydrolase domain-containing protein [Aquirufa nivalisilvae]|uniref:serine hydrolase domain-containing protein n=1 Tax=Aquirufa nivalisilvae TaxID=2516557 RepID=UPI001032FDA8|nr:serine hydrolase domain-containing protein [Aquirufa nivalisilvae]TBH73872.1 class A beta-lactamase-related serine hydrolase [Aquirufa nivalisilvae]
MKKIIHLLLIVIGIQSALGQSTEEKIKAFIPQIDQLFKKYVEKEKLPSAVYGLVYQGKLIHTQSIGLANIQQQIPASSQIDYRIASMTKSFTTMAILKLRDEGKLQLDEPAHHFIPELKNQKFVTKDAPEITIRHLMTHAAGFPEDNPWGDRQLGISEKAFSDMLNKGISFSNNPGVSFEYSNMGFALLGSIIKKVSGQSYQTYITEKILKPLGMTHTYWEYMDVPKNQLALGYRWINQTWVEQPLEHDGAYGAMGGLITTMEDFSHYVAFHLSSWPERNDPESGPIKRSSVREMQFPWNFISVNAKQKYPNGQVGQSFSAYAYGLSFTKDYANRTSISHSGGLPGFGSNWRIFPDYNIGIISFSNLTYANMGSINMQVIDSLLNTTSIPKRSLHVSAILKQRQSELMKILPHWDQAESSGIFAINFFSDYFTPVLKSEAETLFSKVGSIKKVHDMIPENQLRGKFRIEGEKGDLEVSFTLSPENPALIQEFHLNEIKKAHE